MKNKRQNGEVVVEASIIVTFVVIFISIMLYLGMVMYQQTLVSVIANQTASNLAQLYSNNNKDAFSGYIDSDYVYQPITYGNIKNDAYLQVIKQKADIFAKYRLKSSRILASENTVVDVDIVKKPNELLKSQIVVTIRDTYDIPLVGLFGTNSIVEFASSGRADCVDILEYLNGVEAIGDPENSNVTYLPDSDNCTVTFIADKNNAKVYHTVVVHRGESINSSKRYTHSAMPSTNPKKSGYAFDCWVTSSGSVFNANTTVNTDMVVYGRWKCNVTLKADGGKVNAQNEITLSVIAGARATLPNATRSGYNFGGWYTGKNGSGARYVSNNTIITAAVTLYAKWSCAHSSRYESGRTGSICEGGTVYYKCSTCHCDLGSAYYGGTDHNWGRCNIRHSHKVEFNGTGKDGGCGQIHPAPSYSYCAVCLNCGKASGNWCANGHNWPSVKNRPIRIPNKHNY